ncbi:MAG: hypothetical protein ACODAB_10095 [Gemmatimonadota bacterium]
MWRANGLLAAALLVLAACSDDAPPTAPDSPIVLESSELLPGGEGLLRSADFAEFELKPAVDESNSVVPNRWSNFTVEVDGTEVDSWRVGEDAIGFEVPVADAGTAVVEVSGNRILPASFSVVRRGLVETVRYDPCYSVLSSYDVSLGLVGTSAGDVLMQASCWKHLDTVTSNAYHRVLPPMADSFEPIGETLAFRANSGGEYETILHMYAPGLTFAPGMDVLERRVDATAETPEDPSLWRVRVGRTVEFVEPASCPTLPNEPRQSFTVAELADGLCLTIDTEGRVRRNGELIFDLYGSTVVAPPVRFTRSVDGRTLLTGIKPDGAIVFFETDDAYPVFGADGDVAYTLSGFYGLRSLMAAWSPDGEEFYLLYQLSEFASFPVLERRDAVTGDLLARHNFERGHVGGVTMVESSLWIALGERNGGVLHVVDPRSLREERTVRFDGFPAVEPGSVVIPDESGRRVYIVSYWDARLYGFIVDVY